MTQHNELVRQEFTKQAQAFAGNPWITDEQRIARLVAAAQLTGTERVLDTATGPGYIAEAFAASAREVIGVDLTEAMLAIARERTAQRGIRNISFRAGDVQHLPFDDGEFDVVVCRFALHHLEHPAVALREMARVCRSQGTVLAEDLFASERPERAAFQDRFERLRDSSHVRALPMSELLRDFCAAGLEVDAVTMNDLAPEVERWMATTETSPANAAEIRHLLEQDLRHDLSGTRPFRDENGRLRFTARTVIMTGRKLRPAQAGSLTKQST